MKTILCAVIIGISAATPSPSQRPPPAQIDISERPDVELVTKSSGSILVASGGTALAIDMKSPDGSEIRSITFDWKATPQVQSTIERKGRVTVFVDSDADGLPDIRRVFERTDGELHLVSSERLSWTASSDQYDPSARRAKKG